MPIYRAWVQRHDLYRCFYADNNDMPKEIGLLKELMQKELLSSCLLGYTKDQSTGKTVFKLTIGTHELTRREIKDIGSVIKQDLIQDMLWSIGVCWPKMEYEDDIPVNTMLFQIQPPDLRAKDVPIPMPRPTDDPTSVNCVFAFEGLSLITYSQECEDITCLEIKSPFLAE